MLGAAGKRRALQGAGPALPPPRRGGPGAAPAQPPLLRGPGRGTRGSAPPPPPPQPPAQPPGQPPGAAPAAPGRAHAGLGAAPALPGRDPGLAPARRAALPGQVSGDGTREGWERGNPPLIPWGSSPRPIPRGHPRHSPAPSRVPPPDDAGSGASRGSRSPKVPPLGFVRVLPGLSQPHPGFDSLLQGAAAFPAHPGYSILILRLSELIESSRDSLGWKGPPRSSRCMGRDPSMDFGPWARG